MTSNILWIGTRNGFSKYHLQNHTFQNFAHIPINGDGSGVDVSAFYQQQDGTLWVGTRYNGLLLIKETIEKITDVNPNLSYLEPVSKEFKKIDLVQFGWQPLKRTFEV
jgi:ligand-binding sensor domain-containing protein